MPYELKPFDVDVETTPDGQAMARHGVEAVLSGHCGPKAFRTLSAAGIKIYAGVSGTVEEAIESFKAGELEPLDTADVEGHWA